MTPRAARIREHAAIYEALDPFGKKLIDEGLFDIGFPAEAAYMALGKPNRVTTSDSPHGPVETWVYKNFIFGNNPHVVFPVPASAAANRAQQGRSAQPRTPEIADPPMATLLLDLRDGRIIGARLE